MLQTNQLLHARYRIAAILGQGAFGTVYRATDTRLNHQVAVKEMMPQPGIDPALHNNLRHQFYREAQTLAKLQHSHLVNVTDYFTENGNDYLVMRFVKGQSLASLIRQGQPLPAEHVRIWALQLLDALAYCHTQGVLHRDIKPDNIIIRDSGEAVLVDFGLVKLWDPTNPRTTMAIQGYGTPAYAPPEQGIQRGNHTDARSDIYSLGATLYHALTGQTPPSVGERMANPERYRTAQQLLPSGFPQLTNAVIKGMNIARNERFESAGAMRHALINVPAPTPQRPISQKLLLGVSGALGVLVLVLGGLLWQGGFVGGAIATATKTQIAAVETPTLEPTATPTLEPTLTDTPSPTPTDIPPSPTVVPASPTPTIDFANNVPRTGGYAPDFELLDSDGTLVRLSDDLRQHSIVLVFYYRHD